MFGELLRGLVGGMARLDLELLTFMKSLSCIGAGLLACVWMVSGAVVVNDGTTTDGLVRLASPPTSATATTTLATTPAGNLEAGVVQEFFDLPMHTAWYATAYVATGGNYTASSEFTPAAAGADLDGGVVAWLNEETSEGLLFALRSGSSRTYCQVAVYDLSTGVRQQSVLFNLEGVEVDPGFQLPNVPESGMTAGYNPANPVKLQVIFEEPGTNDLEVLPGVTARLTAVGYQGAQAVTTPMVLLTTMPVPVGGERLVGYYAVYNGILDADRAIGRLDNLTVDGEVGLGNQQPTVTLTSPLEGQLFGSGEVIGLAASAADADGQVVQVEFFADSQLLSTDVDAPYSHEWLGASIGIHTVHAVVTDDRGAKQSSTVVSVEVTNRAPSVVITSPGSGTSVAPGETVQIASDASDVDGSVAYVEYYIDGVWLNTAVVPPYSSSWLAAEAGVYEITAVAVDDLGAKTTSAAVSVQVGQVVTEPAVMSVTMSGGNVVVTWDRTGFQLQSANSLLGPWSNVGQNTTGVMEYTEAFSGQPKYYRLVAEGGVTPPDAPVLAMARDGGSVVVMWDQRGYQLQTASDLGGVWVDEGNTVGVTEYSVSVAGGNRYFRLRP
ncbi:MAG: putative b-glycosidase, glycoside hydrolase family 8 protein [Verrucomicrobiota bacterium]|jgi:hypothetical protein